MTTKKPLNYLDTDGTVHVLWHKLKKVEQLNATVSKYLDKNLRAYCKATGFSQGKLTLIAANSSIASQLHMQSAELLRQLKQEEMLRSIQTIHCKVQVQAIRISRAAVKNKTINPLSAKSARLISDIADTISDIKLREAMKRLAKNTTIKALKDVK